MDSTVSTREGVVTFRYERRLKHPVAVVWRAITTPDGIAQWSGWRPELDLTPGGRYVTDHGIGEPVVDEVIRVEPPRVFEHTFWAKVNPSARVTWELTPTDDGCVLALIHSLSLEDVKHAVTLGMGDDPPSILARNGKGWHRLLDVLAARLDGVEPPPFSDDDQQALVDHYRALLPERASRDQR